MTDSTFVNNVTLTDSDWFNDVNRLHYTIFGDPATARAALDALYVKGADVVSAATLDLTATTGDFIHVTGSTGPITAITLNSGDRRYVVFDSTPSITHNATTLILPGGVSITAAAGDVALFSGDGSGNTRCLAYFSGLPVNRGVLTTKGDTYVATASSTVTRLQVGSNGTLPMARSADTNGIAYVAALNKAIYGLTYDTGTDTVNDWNINVGGAMDATGAYWMTLGTALGKQSDVAWAVGGTTGAPAGALDTGAVGNNDYYIWLIARSDTGVVDALFSLSSTAPTMPTNYDFKRLIGWFKRTGGTVVAAHTYEIEGGGLEMTWDVPTLDINLSNTLTTARRTDAVKVPLNFSVEAHLNVIAMDASTTAEVWVCCPDQTDAAPSFTAAPLGNIQSSANGLGGQIKIRTSAAGLIASRATLATVDLYAVATMGFRWARRN